MVTIGQRLPALTVLDGDGTRVSVEELRTGRPAVLFFMRARNCPVCLHHARALAQLRDELGARDVLAVVVVPGTPADAAAVRRTLGDAVRVVGSDDVSAHRAAGLGRTMLMQHSGTFLVAADGTVAYSRTGTLPTGSFDRAELLDALRRS